ncbi:hypothetical protein GUITHDRAFT_160841 [Guillardia theta CCMP2712]|uniref:PDZ domain-containing protein n=3 Tax=Guillardia theta TaxID=55529 RepID=L1K184_GUITC|nr:hypothetical protein GUITHDRAFT_160841 [Guillardia theta CCMP2712]EKX54215.1 hypothetical protein GUITHDRAFT_160841 [Guillardia theta CCMP2712]|eukprot:XP_005841195.1 hypothetical protein GUITHDRAFT_160841 [Guillardia theta CCMP2712]
MSDPISQLGSWFGQERNQSFGELPSRRSSAQTVAKVPEKDKTECFGVGLAFEIGRDSSLFVSQLDPSCSAARSGVIQVHDEILKIDGELVEKQSLNLLKSRVLGRQGSFVNMTFRRLTDRGLFVFEVELMRGAAEFIEIVSQCKLMTKENKKLVAQIRESELTAESHRENMMTMLKDLQKFEEITAQYQALQRRAEGENERLSKEVAQLRQLLADRGEQGDQDLKQREEVEARLLAERKELELFYQGREEELKREVQSLQAVIRDMQAARERSQQEQQQLLQHEQEHRGLTAELEELRTANNNLTARVVKMNEEMTSKRLQGAAREEHMLDQIRQAERESSSLRKEIEGVKTQLELTRLELKEKELEVARMNSGSQEEMKTLAAKHDKSLSKIVKLEEEIWSKKSELQAFEQRIRLLTEKTETVGSERDEWRRRFTNMEEKNKHLMIELEATKSEAKRTVAEVVKEKDIHISSLEEEVETLRADKDRIKVLSSRTRQELFQQRERTESLEEEVRRLGDLMQEEQEGKKKLSQEISLLVRQLDELRDRSSSMMVDESRSQLAAMQEELARERQSRQEAEERLLTALLEREEVVESKDQVKVELTSNKQLVEALHGVGELQVKLSEDIAIFLDSLDLAHQPSWSPLEEEQKKPSWSLWSSDHSASVLELLGKQEASMLVLSSSLGQADSSCERLAQLTRQLHESFESQGSLRSTARVRQEEETAGEERGGEEPSSSPMDSLNHVGEGGEENGTDVGGVAVEESSGARDSQVGRFLVNGFKVKEDDQLKPVVEILRSVPKRGCLWKGVRKSSKLNFSEGESNCVYLLPEQEEDEGTCAPVSSWRTSLDVEEELEVAEEELDQLVRENTRVNAGSSYSFC